MTTILTLPRTMSASRMPLPIINPRNALLAILSAVCLLAFATSSAPTVVRSIAPTSHASVCKCAHCPGGAACCCTKKARCPGGM